MSETEKTAPTPERGQDGLREAVEALTARIYAQRDLLPTRHRDPHAAFTRADAENIARAVVASNWLAAHVAAKQAEAWDEGYMKCSDDFERHHNHCANRECDCATDPLDANPYRAATIGGTA